MDSDKGKALLLELEQLVSRGPGKNERDLNRVQSIVGELTRGQTSYVGEKGQAVAEDFGLWFSPRRWEEYASDPERFRSRLTLSIAKLRMALEREDG
jgi:hypothetical protein